MEETQMLSIQSRSIVPNKEQIHEPIPKRKPIRNNLLAANGPAEANSNVPQEVPAQKSNQSSLSCMSTTYWQENKHKHESKPLSGQQTSLLAQ